MPSTSPSSYLAPDLPPEVQTKQELYRDARVKGLYDKIWQNVGKCAFCDLRDKYILYEQDGVVLTISLFAYIDGHCMIVPRRHVTSAKELTNTEWAAVRKLLYVAKKLIKDTHKVRGIQLVQKDGLDAQSTVGHLHFHCVPFDAPDLSVWNMRQLQHTPLQNVALYKQTLNIGKVAQKFDKKYGGPRHEVGESTGADDELVQGVATVPSPYNLDWTNLAFASKKSVHDLRATFIMAPRYLSEARFIQLVKEYLPKGNIVLGLAKEPYVDGLDGQAQFKMLQQTDVQRIIDKVNSNAKTAHKIYTLSYHQRETKYVLQSLRLQKVVLVNGSWYHSFHTLPTYYVLASNHIAHEFVSPFANEAEARQYAITLEQQLTMAHPAPTAKILSESEMMQAAGEVAKMSFDYTFQTGTTLGKKTKAGYKFLARSYNRVTPYQTYAMHNGATPERFYAPPGDLNHYDAVHAEVKLLLEVQKKGISLAATTLFINLLPCPTCCRMFCETDIAEFVYRHDHSDGFAARMLVTGGKTVRRMIG